MIRLHGFEVAPFLLPKTIPDRVAYLEIVRQLAFSDFMHLKSYGRKYLVPSTLCFSDFTTISYTGYESIGSKINFYGMPLGNKREKFDPEHFYA